VFASAKGFASYVAMVDPEKGRALLTRVAELAAKYGYQPPPRPPRSPGTDSRKALPSGPVSASPVVPTSAPQAPLPSPAAPDPAPPPPAAPENPSTDPAPKKKWWKLF
jgi:hypothetical protein